MQEIEQFLDYGSTVKAIDRGMDQNPYLTLDTGRMFDSVECEFETQDEPKLARLRKGQRVTVRGLCHGKSLYVGMTECALE